MHDQQVRDAETKGKPAEEWFQQHHDQFCLQPIRRVDDLRSNHVEGDFIVTLEDGQRLLIEVKSDYGNALKWKNVQIEMENHGQPGWYKWCLHNGVTHICWLQYSPHAAKGLSNNSQICYTDVR